MDTEGLVGLDGDNERAGDVHEVTWMNPTVVGDLHIPILVGASQDWERFFQMPAVLDGKQLFVPVDMVFQDGSCCTRSGLPAVMTIGKLVRGDRSCTQVGSPF